jgi:hypothetical protein
VLCRGQHSFCGGTERNGCGKQQLEYQTIKQCFNRINDKQLYGTSTPYDVIREELDNDLSKED